MKKIQSKIFTRKKEWTSEKSTFPAAAAATLVSFFQSRGDRHHPGAVFRNTKPPRNASNPAPLKPKLPQNLVSLLCSALPVRKGLPKAEPIKHQLHSTSLQFDI